MMLPMSSLPLGGLLAPGGFLYKGGYGPRGGEPARERIRAAVPSGLKKRGESNGHLYVFVCPLGRIVSLKFETAHAGAQTPAGF